MLGRQVVWMPSDATRFTAICEACLADPGDSGDALAYRLAKVEGSLRQDADVGFCRCRRGHRLSIRRSARPAVAPLA